MQRFKTLHQWLNLNWVFHMFKKNPSPEDKVLRDALFMEFNAPFFAAHLKGVAPVYQSAQTTHSVRRCADLTRVISILSEASPHEKGPFVSLGVRWTATSKTRAGSHCPWRGTATLLAKAPASQALALFRALAHAIGPRQSIARTELMQAALAQPAWACQAMQQNPEIFGGTRAGILPRWSLQKTSAWGKSAHVMMASVPLLGACLQDYQNMFEGLQRIGVVIPKGPKGRTMLHLAAAHQGPAAMAAFIAHFAGDLDTADRLGQTPLHVAVLGGQVQTLEVLLRAGAAFTSAQMGDSPLDMAVKSKRLDCVRVMCEHGARSTASALDLRSARSWAQGPEMKGFLDAQIARQAIEEEMAKIYR